MRRLLGGVLVLALVATAAVAFAAHWAWRRALEPYRGFTGAEQFVDIPPGAGVAEIRRRLVAAGVARDDLSLRIALWSTGKARALQAGQYRIDQPVTAFELVEKLASGDVYLERVTFPEGLTRAEMAELYEARGMGPASSFLEASSRGRLVGDLDPSAKDLEGYLFPDTYGLPHGATVERLVEMMVERFRERYSATLRASAEQQGLTTRQVVSLAALVEKETASAEERPMVAAVYRNRLKRGMPMQADPTVVYALRLAGRYDGNIRKADLLLDSPYNTYRYPGLPPGPIAAPGIASIEAVLSPANVDFLYFVSRNNGSHVFAATLREHNTNVAEYQIRYFREQRARAGAAGGARPQARR